MYPGTWRSFPPMSRDTPFPSESYARLTWRIPPLNRGDSTRRGLIYTSFEQNRLVRDSIYRSGETALDEQTEQELLERARAGDFNAFADLQARLEAQVRRFIRRLIGSDTEDDIVQEAFFALYMNLEQMEPPSRLRPFLFRVVRNRCYDQLRALGRYEFVSLDEEPDDSETLPTVAVDDQPQPDETTHWLLLVAQVEAAVEHLPEL